MKLIKVRTYADQNGFSVQYVYRLIKQGKVESEEIDGVKFIKVEK
jgi:predicted DNA-binding transcriptional regulator AlpA